MADLQLRRYSNTAPDMTLVTTISASDTTVEVNTATGLPDVPFTIEIETEVMEVTQKTGTTLTVTRGFDNSNAAIHTDGTLVQHVLTADDFDHRWQDVVVTRPFGTLDDEFDDGTKDAAYIETNPTGSATWTEQNGVLSCLFSGQSTNDVSVIVKPATGIGIGSALQIGVRGWAQTNSAYIGPVLTSGFTTSSSVVWQFVRLLSSGSPATTGYSLRSGTMTNMSTSHYALTSNSRPITGWLHMRLLWATVNTYRAYWSIDGVSWTPIGQTAYTISSVTPPAYMGVGVSAWGGSGDKLATIDYMRVVTL